MSDTQTTSAQAACGCWTGPWCGTNQPPRCLMHTSGFALAAPNGGIGPQPPMAWAGLTQPRFGAALCTCRVGGLVNCTAHANEGSRADFDVVTPYAPPLSEQDVERIAKRVVELLKAPGG